LTSLSVFDNILRMVMAAKLEQPLALKKINQLAKYPTKQV
jgi:hypothetical protein